MAAVTFGVIKKKENKRITKYDKKRKKKKRLYRQLTSQIKKRKRVGIVYLLSNPKITEFCVFFCGIWKTTLIKEWQQQQQIHQLL